MRTKVLFFLLGAILMADTSLFNRSAEEVLKDIKKNKQHVPRLKHPHYSDEWKPERQGTVEIDFRKLEIRRIKPIQNKEN